jgi:uncharacterized protein
VPPAPTAASLRTAAPATGVSTWRDAIQPVEGGVRLLLHAQPGAGHPRFPNGYDPWRGRLGIRVKEPARDGKANAAVLEALADFFGLPSTAVVLESGATDSRKAIVLLGVSLAEARNRLVPALGA